MTPPHDFACPVCFPPEDRRPGLVTSLILGVVAGIVVMLWLLGVVS